MSAPACPLCGDPTRPHHEDDRRPYFGCPTCDLVHVPPEYHLSPADEKAVYDLHDNHPGDAGYRRFLQRTLTPLLAQLQPGAAGLDFGCGPGPTLSVMAEEAGHPCALYDPFYADRSDRLRPGHYGFVTATEVIEHVARPDEVWPLLFSLLERGGWLAVMTKRTTSRAAFATWHYITDPTHVCFYSEATFRWVAARHHATLVVADRDVVLLQRQ